MTSKRRVLLRSAGATAEARCPPDGSTGAVDRAGRVELPRVLGTRLSLIGLLYFGAASALAGGILGAVVNGASMPVFYLEGTPFRSYLIPGLVLGIVVGGTQLVAGLALQRHHHRGLDVAAIAGLGMVIWIFVELAVLREYSFLQSVYFGLGVAELTLVHLLSRSSTSEPQLSQSPCPDSGL